MGALGLSNSAPHKLAESVGVFVGLTAEFLHTRAA